jgi:Trp operon repressor
MNKQLQQLLQKEMTRHEFLATLGMGLASIMGFSSIIKLMNSGKSSKTASFGYGSSPYGR